MGRVWGEYGESMGKVWERYEKGMGKVWDMHSPKIKVWIEKTLFC
jgi:hypothetical protein